MTNTLTTRQQIRNQAAEAGWSIHTEGAADVYWVNRLSEGKDWSWRHVATKWTDEGELETIWLRGALHPVSAADFTDNGQHTIDYLLSFVFDLELASEPNEAPTHH